MYSLVSAIAKSFATQGRWESLDISTLTFEQLYTQYIKVTAVLTNPFVTGQVALNLADIQAMVGDTTQTFSEFLTANGNTTLPTTTPVPVLDTQYVHYKDAFRAGYSVQPVGPTQAPDAPLPPADKTWLFLSKAGVDFNFFYANCLVSVNGYIHRLTANSTGAWVIDGMKTARNVNQNQIGILNFQKVSPFTVVPVTPSMIYKQSSGQLYRNQMRINLGQDLSQKTVALVLGGYLHILDAKTLYRIGQTQVAIDFNNFPLIERYYESRKFLDYSSLPFNRSTINAAQLDVNDFLSDANLLAYMQLSQTFFVILDNVEIFKDEQFVQSAQMPGMLVAYEEPVYPLVNGIGKLGDYWSTYEDKQWSVTVVDNFWQRRAFKTLNLLEQEGISDNRITTDPVRHSKAHFLVIGTDTPVTASA